jgi:hypothetical protein
VVVAVAACGSRTARRDRGFRVDRGGGVGASLELTSGSSLCGILERLIPQLLAGQHPEWRGESLDGFYFSHARRDWRWLFVRLVGVVYAFDGLGFLQFEQLCEALLELEGGIGAGTWVGEADRCRSVLSGTPLGRPLADSVLPAPVLLQCAWVRSGQWSDLLGSVGVLVARRPEDFSVAASFVLLTNLEVPTWFARAVAARVRPYRVRVRVLGPTQLAARVDARVELRRTMPSLLGLRDLSALIDSDVADRSSLDRDAADQLAAVFMPTRAYRRAFEVLAAHRFAVLTGPPEMGKTAIARMIGLAQMTAGWEGYECVRPDDVWRAFDARRSQVFIADDALGSTEYRPDAAERWARDMERILRVLDDRHWLIWTSRPAHPDQLRLVCANAACLLALKHAAFGRTRPPDNSPVERDYHDAYLLTSVIPEELMADLTRAEHEVRSRATHALELLAKRPAARSYEKRWTFVRSWALSLVQVAGCGRSSLYAKDDHDPLDLRRTVLRLYLQRVCASERS